MQEVIRPSVALSNRELYIAEFVAQQRNEAGLQAHADNSKHGNSRSSFRLHLEGATFEMAFAKAANRYWSGAGVTWHDDDDVGSIQVRGTTLPNGRLLIRPDDLIKNRDKKWVCIRGDNPFEICGWIYGYEAEDEKYLFAPNGRPPAYFVPVRDLRPLETL